MRIDYNAIEDSYERNSLRSLELYFEYIFSHMVSYRFCYDNKMIIKTDDDECYIFDTRYNSIRRLPNSSNMDRYSFSKEFGRRVEYLLEQRRISKQEFADYLDINPSQLSNYLNGRNAPSFYLVDKMARILECSIEELRHLD